MYHKKNIGVWCPGGVSLGEVETSDNVVQLYRKQARTPLRRRNGGAGGRGEDQINIPAHLQ